ncbi:MULTISPECIES: hypothetical protein [unclassified Rhizobium]|uniref:hypothetical protein n=1 Tax=unclassified Rhizobium TaxID=2613769 RepID=UPI001AD9C4AA|nr:MULTISPECIES: hypothetical protein [unclassified Rhizobium]MBO9102134.1 hypothetical protein [Rhizobium sp. L58/93]MBO9136794.1 hypothetical protein [Rhizobium sp. B209b/85]MBO9172342.1 hypothetical protein [Rhizobium sp. L245/93]MBO9186496.1 hypothetical protein [Rhizobium sp. E27B/91]QXZ86111.1 hypothetical protein J5287_23730 [Rhizobium sp. K1/93]
MKAMISPGTEEIFAGQVDSFSTGNCPRGLSEYLRGDLGMQKREKLGKYAALRQKYDKNS